MKDYWICWLKAAGIRAVRTFAEAALAYIGTSATVLGDVNWIGVPFHSYRELFATGVSEIMRTNFMNVALFYPAGLLVASLLPENWSHCRIILSAGIMLALFSLSIEYVQFSAYLASQRSMM